MTTPLLRAAVLPLAILGIAAGCGSKKPRGDLPDRSVVTAKDLENPNEPIEKVLQSKVSGLEVRRTADGGIAVRIRGSYSFVGTDAPLYLVDDVPIEPGPEGELIGVDPYNIESIKVLKGADAGIYGIRGFNGVIVITTKKPPPPTP